MTFTFLIIFYVYVFLLLWVATYGYFKHNERIGKWEIVSKPLLFISAFLMALLWPITIPLRILTWLLVRTEV